MNTTTTKDEAMTIPMPEYIVTVWGFWNDQLAGKPVTMHEACPHQGFYRDGSRAIALYFDHDWNLFCDENGEPTPGEGVYKGTDDKKSYVGSTPEMQKIVERWTHFNKRAVTKTAHDDRIKNGCWPGEELAHTLSNMPPAENSYEDLREKIEEAIRSAQALIEKGAANTEEKATLASNTVASLMALASTAEGLRVVEKQPHLDAGRAVDAKWTPLVNRAKGVFQRLREAVLQPYFDEQERVRLKAEREQREKAEALRQEAADREANAKRAEEEAMASNNTAAADLAKREYEAAEEINARADTAAATAVTIAAMPTAIGTTGHRARTRTVKETAIIDREAFRAFALSQPGIRAEYEALDQKHADAFTRANVAAPGLTVTKKKVAA